jgi:hypothetical protein
LPLQRAEHVLFSGKHQRKIKTEVSFKKLVRQNLHNLTNFAGNSQSEGIFFSRKNITKIEQFFLPYETFAKMGEFLFLCYISGFNV